MSIIAITMPKWGIEMTEGTVTGWRIGEGAAIERGTEILDVETEKIVNAVEAPGAGVLRRILAKEGETHAVGALIGVIADAQTHDAAIDGFVTSFIAAVVSFDPDDATPSTGAAGPTPATAVPAAVRAAPLESAETDIADDGYVSPIARRVAERLGVDLSQMTGTGRNGRISKGDVEAFAARAAGAKISTSEIPATPTGLARFPAPTSPVRRVRMSARRGTIARRLLESKQSIPHFRLDVDVDFGPLIELRRGRSQSGADRITVNDLLMRAAGLALVRHPMVNAQLEGDEILQFAQADIAIAVAAEAGLVTPIVRAVNLKSVAAISVEIRDLIERARAGALRREEISGGSFTISNLGMHGVTRFDAIINAPQVAILAVGAVTQRAVVRNGALAVGQIATLTLSADHRVVDGAEAAAFLTSLRELLERPAGL